MSKMLVELEWNEEMGPMWMNLDNLKILLYSGNATKIDLLQVKEVWHSHKAADPEDIEPEDMVIDECYSAIYTHCDQSRTDVRQFKVVEQHKLSKMVLVTLLSPEINEGEYRWFKWSGLEEIEPYTPCSESCCKNPW